MKTIRITFALLIILGMLSCEDSPSDTNSNTSPTHGKLKHTVVEYGGCFKSSGAENQSAGSMQTDTAYFREIGDTLFLHINMNYNCCGTLSDSIVILDDKVDIYIADICTSTCVCRCMCNYEFIYAFADCGLNQIDFRIYLRSLNQSNYKLWRELTWSR